jgi:O-methyltransferase involved in polyketide biosynthesis
MMSDEPGGSAAPEDTPRGQRPWWAPAEEDEPPAKGVDVGTPHIARIYDYVLGGKDNFAVDREAAEDFIKTMPGIVTTIRAGRPVLGRMVRFLVDSGIRQFLDIGAGLPTAANTHEVAQQAAPECRIAYADNDPMVLAHARALLTSTPEGATTYIHADLRDTSTILSQARDTLDFTQSVAIMLSGVLHCIPDSDDPYGIVTTLLTAVPSGSYLLLAHPASDVSTEARPATTQINTRLSEPVTFRTREQIARFLNGLDIVEPGLVQPQDWRPDPQAPPTGPLSVWCAVARKPLSPHGNTPIGFHNTAVTSGLRLCG